MTTAQTYADLGEAAWRWVLDQVRWDDGPWIPESVPHEGGPPEERDGMHSGIGGLAHLLAEVRTARPWTAEESALADGIAARVRAGLATTTAYSYFDGLVSDLGVLSALDAVGAAEAIARLAELATDDGWEQPWMTPPRFAPHARINDVTLGTAGNLLGAVWARRQGTPGAEDLAHRAADILLAEGEPTDAGTNWSFLPPRHTEEVRAERGDMQMPNWSHGLAGIAAALAVAGAELGRPDLVAAARSGAEHLVTLGDRRDGGFVLPHEIPRDPDLDEVTFTWCHGPTGTSLLFTALEYAGVAEVAGETPAQWQRRCLRSIRTSGIPERLRPGFWDNDGRCCGTAGVGDIFLDAWQRRGVEDDLVFAQVLGDALVERAVIDGDRACWRFTEHRNAEPLLPPGVGWMQGTAGIAACLMRLARVLREGRTAPAEARLDTWWNLPESQGSMSPARMA
ncbi:Lanthionine synthetase C-like protein [Nocardioides alpinus]|uniref:Lanthionine synthetase C-like protein n=1 Tax=Nocardioides alpinus TaxID=748909 RepID=A0A1I0YAG5_9ACTN|nr:lanthionine synthetase LanC family protein [Nocardioides alpinus]SFB10261.1 Lanthionine synthetase C-like protein [Nocardioides alpinus]